jgi:hypothetical protein
MLLEIFNLTINMSGNQQRHGVHIGEGSFCIPSESQLLHGYTRFAPVK